MRFATVNARQFKLNPLLLRCVLCVAKLCGLNRIMTRERKDEMQDFVALCLKFLQSIFQRTAHDFAIIILMTSFIKIKIYI